MASTHFSEMESRNLMWSKAEKLIARKVFEFALQRELDTTKLESKRRAAKIRDASELWDLEFFLSERRKEIDRKFDYRYSVLTDVFGYLIREGSITEQDLQGLREDKFYFIRRIASF